MSTEDEQKGKGLSTVVNSNISERKGLVSASQAFSANSISNVTTDGGDFSFGTLVKNNISINFPAPNPDKIRAIIQQSQSLAEDSIEYRSILEELENYCKPRPGRKIIGLQNKLVAGKRDDLIEDAEYLKDRFARRLKKYQLSAQHMAVHLHILAQINERFRSKIIPLIKDGHSRATIDSLISDIIIQPLVAEVSGADSSITADTISGMLFLLTGNCHISWAQA